MAAELTGRQLQSSATLGVSAASLQAGLPQTQILFTWSQPDDSKAWWRATANAAGAHHGLSTNLHHV